MKKDGTSSVALLALVCSLIALLFSTMACVYVATYLENGERLSGSLDKLSGVLDKKK